MTTLAFFSFTIMVATICVAIVRPTRREPNTFEVLLLLAAVFFSLVLSGSILWEAL